MRSSSRFEIALFLAAALHAETGYKAWLRYPALTGMALDQYRQSLPPVLATLADSTLESSARSELIRGIRGMLGRTPRAESAIPQENAIVLGTLDQIRRAAPQWSADFNNAATGVATIGPGGYWLKTVIAGRVHYTVITAPDDRGVLYGAFALLRDRQAEPETIRDPKQVCASLLTNSQNQMAQSEMYARVAQRLDVAVLVSRCPSGFRPFAERVGKVFGHGLRAKA